MAVINVNRGNVDPYYRYKMPLLIAKVEGKGNGIKTVIVNMVDVAKALNRPASYTCKFFGCELGAQTQMDIKNGRYIVNGAHDSPKLQDMLDVFIKKFVLCPECENPETDLIVQASKGRIRQTCKACGYQGMVDMRHKLTTFILKNPPTQEEASGKKDKKARRAEKQRGKGKNGKEATTPSSPTEPTAEEELETPPVVNGRAAAPDDEEWSVDTSDAAMKARMDDLSDQVSALAHTQELELASKNRIDLFYKFVEDLMKSGGPPAIAGGVQKVKAEAERLDVTDKAAGVLAELLYTEKILTQIKEFRPIILHFVVENRKAQKYLLGVFEMIVGKVHPELIPKAAHILKAFYDNDILEEEAILEWAGKLSKKHVKKETSKQIHEKAAPFVKWLQEAEEESSGDEDEDEGVTVDFSNASTGPTLVTEPKPEPATADADDIDIDAI